MGVDLCRDDYYRLGEGPKVEGNKDKALSNVGAWLRSAELLPRPLWEGHTRTVEL